MSTVFFDISMSLDGYIAAAGQTPEEPLGRDGERLHSWTFAGNDDDRAVMEGGASVGAIICGRRTYDDSFPWWKADGPTGAARLPVVVVTHQAPTDTPENGVYQFVAGIDEALAAAKIAAGGRDVTIMGGASILQQALSRGQVDVIQLHIVPVLFGKGLRVFDNLPDHHVTLELQSTVTTPSATHLRYNVHRTA